MALPLRASRCILSRKALFKIPERNHGFVVLIPELGEDDAPQGAKNERDIDFSSITTESCKTRLSKDCAFFEDKINYLAARLETQENVDLFKHIMDPLEKMLVQLDTSWAIAKALSFGDVNRMPPLEYRSLHSYAAVATARRYISKPIYNACKEILEKNDNTLTDEQRRIAQMYVLEGKLNGLELDEKTLKAFKFSLNTGLHKKAEFDLKLRESIRMLSPTFDTYDSVKHLPPELIKAMAKDPEKPTEGPWSLTLGTYMVDTLLEHCPDRSLRLKVWELDVTKASLYQERLLQNSVGLEEIRYKEQLKAETLGYKSYIDLSLETKMAGSLENIYNTFDIILDAAWPAQEREMKELTEFASKNGQKEPLNVWDVPFWSRKYKMDVYQTKEESIKSYFPMEKVLTGLFELVEGLYNLKIVKGTKVGWDQDVEYYDVFDLSRSTSEPAGSFYFDPYKRDVRAVKQQTREDNGWMIPLRCKSTPANTTPLAALIFNFDRPTSEMPCLLPFNGVNALFQEFGKMLRHILTTVEHGELAGTSHVEWDAAMVADYFMANWLQKPSVLQQISGHYDTGNSLPANMIENINKSRQHMAGYNLCKELYLSEFDLELNSGSKFWMDIMKRLWPKYFVIPQYRPNSHVCSWATVFTQNWAAAYYSHLWSRMLAADLFSAFDEISTDNSEDVKELAQRYRETFLAVGGTYPAGEVFRRFRGRDPCPQPLLSSLGLITASPEMESAKRLEQR